MVCRWDQPVLSHSPAVASRKDINSSPKVGLVWRRLCEDRARLTGIRSIYPPPVACPLRNGAIAAQRNLKRPRYLRDDHLNCGHHGSFPIFAHFQRRTGLERPTR